MKSLLFLPVLFLAWSCNSDPEPEIVQYQVNHHLRTAQGFIPTLSLMVREQPDSDWGNLFQNIEGFDYQWGFNYQVAALVTPIENPPQDGSNVQITLLEVLEKTPIAVGTTFDLLVKTGGTDYLIFDRGVLSLLRQISIRCDGDDCDPIRNAVAQNNTVRATFEHIDNQSIRLVDFEIID